MCVRVMFVIKKYDWTVVASYLRMGGQVRPMGWKASSVVVVKSMAIN